MSNSRRQTRGILHRDELDVEAHLGVVVGICSLLLFAAVCCRLLFCCCCRVVHVLNMSLVLAARARALRLRGEAVWYSTRRAARLVSRVCRDPRPVSLRQSPTRPRDMTMSRMWGGGPTRQTRQTRWTLSEEDVLRRTRRDSSDLYRLRRGRRPTRATRETRRALSAEDVTHGGRDSSATLNRSRKSPDCGDSRATRQTHRFLLDVLGFQVTAYRVYPLCK